MLNTKSVKGKITYNYDIGIVRYRPDGGLDTSFGGTGRVVTNVSTYQSGDTSNQFDSASAVAILPDGKILVGGGSATGNGTGQGTLVRYNTDGTLDTSFGVGGVMAFESAIGDLVVQSDGKILARAGGSVLRFDASGAPDPSFGPDGTGAVRLNPGMNWSALGHSMAVGADGAIVLAGHIDRGGGDFGLVLARLTSSGLYDTTFGGTGTIFYNLSTATTSPPDEFNAGVHIQADGKIVVATKRLVARFGADGVLDPNYGVRDQPPGAFHASAVQPDGKLVTVGQVGVTDGRRQHANFVVARFLGDSAPAISPMMAPSTATHEETPTPSDSPVMETRRTAQESQAITVVDPSVDMHRAGEPGGEVLVAPALHAEASDADDPIGLLWGFDVDRT